MPAQIQFHPDFKRHTHGYSDLRYWSVITAYGLAAAEDIKLTSLHLVFLEWLRQDYFQHGASTMIRLVFRIESAFADQGGVLLLMSLFPKGPMQALKIAGLPIQRNAANYSVSMH